MDRADGAGTILFDLAARGWSAEIVDALGIDPGWLPETYEGPEITGALTPGAAEAVQLRPGTPVVAGAGDRAAAAIGVGSIDPGSPRSRSGPPASCSRRRTAPRWPEGRLHAFCHAVPGRWHLMGVMLSAAGSLRWFRDALAPGIAFDETPVRGPVPPGSDGLLFLPYLTGERTPHPDPLARGAFVGLSVRLGRGHLTRAILEGVAFGLRDSIELMRAVGLGALTEIRATGGGIRSPLWRQILADVLGGRIAITSTTEGAALGAAILAAVGAGWFRSVPDACEAIVRTDDVIEPSDDLDRYAGPYERYTELYPALAPTMHAMVPKD